MDQEQVSAEKRTHLHVPHPVSLRISRRQDGMNWVSKANDWTATRLGLIFGSVWIVWIFFIWPLIAQHLGTRVQSETSYYAQSWIQLFALPLFVYIGNKLQRSSDAQSDTIHEALTHIATVEDQNAELLAQNTELTQQIHEVTMQIHQRNSA